VRHFGQYGEIIDSVIMKDRYTSQPRGFGFITYSDTAVVDKVIEETHVINGKQVEIKRTIPKGAMQSSSKDFKTRKIFVGGLPSALTEDDFKSFFERYGTVVDHQIMFDRETKRSRGFGFVVFASEETVDDLLANGNMIDLAGSKVEIKKAEPKKSSNPPPSGRGRSSRSSYDSGSRDHPSSDNYGGLANPYGSYRGGGFDPYRSDAGFSGGRLGSYGGMGEFGVGYGRYYAGLGAYGAASSFGGYPSRFGLYGGYGGAYAGGDLSGYRRTVTDESFGGPGNSGFGGDADEGFGGPGSSGFGPGSSGFGGAAYGGAYDPALGGYGPAGAPDRNKGSFAGGFGRYHPYG